MNLPIIILLIMNLLLMMTMTHLKIMITAHLITAVMKMRPMTTAITTVITVVIVMTAVRKIHPTTAVMTMMTAVHQAMFYSGPTIGCRLCDSVRRKPIRYEAEKVPQTVQTVPGSL